MKYVDAHDGIVEQFFDDVRHPRITVECALSIPQSAADAPAAATSRQDQVNPAPAL